MMVCFDWFFPESVRTLALAGAEIIAHPSNLVLPYCPDAMVIRCLENRVFAVTANRIGAEKRGRKPPLTYIGQDRKSTRLNSSHVAISYAVFCLKKKKKKK